MSVGLCHESSLIFMKIHENVFIELTPGLDLKMYLNFLIEP